MSSAPCVTTPTQRAFTDEYRRQLHQGIILQVVVPRANHDAIRGVHPEVVHVVVDDYHLPQVPSEPAQVLLSLVSTLWYILLKKEVCSLYSLKDTCLVRPSTSSSSMMKSA